MEEKVCLVKNGDVRTGRGMNAPAPDALDKA
jgi:hypothetical protein